MTIAHEEIRDFTRQFSEQIHAGNSLVRTLVRLTQDQQNADFRLIIDAVNAKIQAGETLSGAMANYPDVFNANYITTIRYGEIYGVLDDSLKTMLHSEYSPFRTIS